MTEKIVLGIDLGTSTSCVSIFENGSFKIIPDEFGNKVIPSMVSFTKYNTYVGHQSLLQSKINIHTYYETKRLIGKKYDDVLDTIELLSYNVNKSENGNIYFDVYNKQINPEIIASLILKELKKQAIKYLKFNNKTNVNYDNIDVVITVPAYFNDNQRQATYDASKIANMNCIRIINEPIAAAIAYGLNNSSKKNILVYDFGGGTLDVALLNIENSVFDILGCCGNSQLGGSDFDNKIISYVLSEFSAINQIDDTIMNITSLNLQKLKYECEKAKIRLSNQDMTFINIDKFYNNIDLHIKLTIQNLNDLCSDLFILCLKPIDDLLNYCHLKKENIDEIILVGGTTKMPQIVNQIQSYFNNKKININNSINPIETIAMGAALQGFILMNPNNNIASNITILNVTSLSLGIETVGGIMNVLIPRNTQLPYSITRTYTNSIDYETFVNINIYEGERPLIKDNYLLGNFIFDKLESVPRNNNKINITFDVDCNNILNVSIVDNNNKDNKKVLLLKNKSSNMNKEELDILIYESLTMEEIDKENETIIKLKYKINNMCYCILENINDIELSMKTKIIDDITNIQQTFEENCHEVDDYLKIIKYINDNHSALIFSPKSVYNLESLQTKDYTNIYDDNNKIIQLIDEFREKCSHVLNNIHSYKNQDFIINFINDAIIWSYVTDLQEKHIIDKTNEMNKHLIENYNEYYELSNKEYLEELIFIMLDKINNNDIIDENNQLSIQLTNILEQIITFQININNNKINQINDDFNYEEYYLNNIHIIHELFQKYNILMDN